MTLWLGSYVVKTSSRFGFSVMHLSNHELRASEVYKAFVDARDLALLAAENADALTAAIVVSVPLKAHDCSDRQQLFQSIQSCQ